MSYAKHIKPMMTQKYIRATIRLLFALFVLTLVACGDADIDKPKKSDTSSKAVEQGEHDEHAEGEHDDHAEGEHDEHAESVVRMTPVALKEAGIEVEAIRREPITVVLSAPGRVVPTQGGSAHVGTIIPGRITRLNVSEGSYVARGAVLAELEAFEVGQLKGDLVTARAVVEQTRSAVVRQDRLAKENIGARKNLEEARAAFSVANAGLRSAEARLRTVGIEPRSVGNGSFTSSLPIRSPISGTVSKRHVVLGEFLEANKDAFEVINTSTIWIDAQVPPSIAATLSVGSTGFIRDAENHRHAGSVRFISPTVDTETRTVTVRTEVANPNIHLRPESFVTVEFERGVSGAALTVPKDAIEQDLSSFYVYREHEPGVFERVLVDVGGDSGDKRIIRAGLNEGERIAVSGLFYLKAARLRGELQEHHH